MKILSGLICLTSGLILIISGGILYLFTPNVPTFIWMIIITLGFLLMFGSGHCGEESESYHSNSNTGK